MKIAIKVSNEFEMGFLMGIYKNESWFPNEDIQRHFNHEFCLVPYAESNWRRKRENDIEGLKDYEVVSFKTWANLKGFEVPKCVILNQGTYKIEVYSANCYVKTQSTALYFTPKQIEDIHNAFISLNS